MLHFGYIESKEAAMKTLIHSVPSRMYYYFLSICDVTIALLIMVSLCSTSLLMLYAALGVI